MTETDYYESEVDWRLERHPGEVDERRRLETTLSMIDDGSESLIDVGTGSGAFLSLVEQRSPNLRIAGLERSRAAIGAATCRAPIHEGSADSLPFDDDSFDTVCALEVIEHLPEPVYGAALREMARVARSQVVISVPYRERRLMVVCPGCGCRFSPIFHLRSFDDETMAHLIPGFRLDRVEHVSTEVRWVLTRAAELFRSAVRHVRRQTPVRTRCPQCDRVMLPEGSGLGGGEPRAPASRSARQALLSMAPRAKRRVWIIASYRPVP